MPNVENHSSSMYSSPPSTYSCNISKSFGNMIATPYKSVNRSTTPCNLQSVESPYTSLGSGQSSYASIQQTHLLYGTLRAKAEHANAMHESKSKAVMEALKGLQEKIQRLEVDRTQAENNLRSLASETHDYKDLLRQQQHVAESPMGNSQSKQLESKLDQAQGRCEVLEKQLETMRELMQHNPSTPQSNPPVLFSSPPTSNKHVKKTQSRYSSPPLMSTSYSLLQGESPAIAKLNDLEREHLKLTASQSLTEGKIRELEEKIREERHHRKLLQDKASQLQNAVTAKITQSIEEKAVPEITKKTKKRKKVQKHHVKECVPPQQLQQRQRQCKSASPDHYLLDLHKIPFVVGQSTGRSHSLGANIQNILSIMKSHNNLCSSEQQASAAPAKTVPIAVPYSNKYLNELLSTLQDEFAQLGFEHREIASRLSELDDPKLIGNCEKALDGVVQRMETKSKQIHAIRDHVTSLERKPARLNPGKSKTKCNKEVNNKNLLTVNNGQEVEVVTTIRTKDPKRVAASSSTNKINNNKEILRNVKKLQTTLRKDDLKWL